MPPYQEHESSKKPPPVFIFAADACICTPPPFLDPLLHLFIIFSSYTQCNMYICRYTLLLQMFVCTYPLHCVLEHEALCFFDAVWLGGLPAAPTWASVGGKTALLSRNFGGQLVNPLCSFVAADVCMYVPRFSLPLLFRPTANLPSSPSSSSRHIHNTIYTIQYVQM